MFKKNMLKEKKTCMLKEQKKQKKNSRSSQGLRDASVRRREIGGLRCRGTDIFMYIFDVCVCTWNIHT